MTNSEIRHDIEYIIQHQKVPKCNGNFKDAHMYYYDIFFSIFESLYNKYCLLVIKPKIIDFIESEGKLLEYYEIVNGHHDSVRHKYYEPCRHEADKRFEDHINFEIEQRRNKWLSENKQNIETKILNGTSQWSERSDYIKYIFNDDNCLNAIDENFIQNRILGMNP